MQSLALPVGHVFQPHTWVPDWLKRWATRLRQPGLERREAPRRRMGNLVAHYWEGESAAAPHVVRDISTSGAFLLADFQWGPGTVLTLTLKSEGEIAQPGTPVSFVVSGRVVRRTAQGVGIRFVFAHPREPKKLAEFLRNVADERDAV